MRLIKSAATHGNKYHSQCEKSQAQGLVEETALLCVLHNLDHLLCKIPRGAFPGSSGKRKSLSFSHQEITH